MENYEFNNIIDYYSELYNYYISEEKRNRIIHFHGILEQVLGDLDLHDFSKFAEHAILEDYLSTKYPTMGLYMQLYSPMGLN